MIVVRTRRCAKPWLFADQTVDKVKNKASAPPCQSGHSASGRSMPPPAKKSVTIGQGHATCASEDVSQRDHHQIADDSWQREIRPCHPCLWLELDKPQRLQT